LLVFSPARGRQIVGRAFGKGACDFTWWSKSSGKSIVVRIKAHVH
jgi:hypothetical protein